MQRHTTFLPRLSGGKTYPLSPCAEHFSRENIANCLSMSCRFAGQIPVFYSLAEHSILVSRHVPKALALAGLLHEAPRALVGYLPRASRQSLREVASGRNIPPGQRRMTTEVSSYDILCGLWQRSLEDNFGLPSLRSTGVLEADKEIESRELYALFGVQDNSLPAPAEVGLRLWSAADARGEFLARWAELAPEAT